MIESTTSVAVLHNQPGMSRLRSRCIRLVSAMSARVTTRAAGTAAAGIAGSAGRYTGTSARTRPCWIRISDFHDPASGSGVTVR